MTESAKKVARQAESRLDKVAEDVREKFDRVAGGTFADKIKEGRFADQVDRGSHRDRADAQRRGRGGSTS